MCLTSIRRLLKYYWKIASGWMWCTLEWRYVIPGPDLELPGLKILERNCSGAFKRFVTEWECNFGENSWVSDSQQGSEWSYRSYSDPSTQDGVGCKFLKTILLTKALVLILMFSFLVLLMKILLAWLRS